MKVLVTGGLGFIGSHIVEQLVNNNHSVVILDNCSSGSQSNISHLNKEMIEVHFGDIRDFTIVNYLVEKVDTVCHQAALANVPQSFENPKIYHDVNVTGTLNVLEACRFHEKKLVLASSSAVNDLLSPYAYSKYLNEESAKYYKEFYNLDVVCLRYYNVFGERQKITNEGAVIPAFINKILNNKTLSVHGDGRQRRDFIYVKQLANFNVNLLQMPKYALDTSCFIQHVGTGVSWSLLQIIDKLETIHGRSIKCKSVSKRINDVFDSKSPFKSNYFNSDFLQIHLENTYNYYKSLI